MKIQKLVLGIVILMCCQMGYAQQQGINYKALIKDANGNALADTSIRIHFSILEDPQDQYVPYSEYHIVSTDINGIVIVNIGEGTQTSEDDPFLDIAWSSVNYYLSVEVDITGGTNYVDMGTTQFMAVPYAIHATTANFATTAQNAGASSINGLSDGKADTDGSSLFLGLEAGANDDGTDNGNVGVGYQALTSNTLGGSNTANGYQALSSNTTGSSNMANGRSALSSNTTGNFNTANGAYSLSSNTEGSANTANGFWSLFSNTTGSINNANGHSALYSNTIGSNNTANGTQALYSNTEGNSNTANGNEALFSNIYGSNNTATGYRALYNNVGDDFFFETGGSNNTANGYQALFENIEGSNNTANGYQALFENIEGSNNTANGFQALANNTTGNNNAANGFRALFYNTEGVGNTANGYQALFGNTTGHSNTANGRSALLNNSTGYENAANGMSALGDNTTGFQNTANGFRALFNNTTGDNNTANGAYALADNTTGSKNTANGIEALSSNTTGDYNVAIGRLALASNFSGSRNVALGYRAGYDETGSNKLYIANDAANPLIYGEFDTEILEINGATTVKSSVNANPDIILGGTANTTAGDDGIISSDPAYAGSDVFIRSNDAVVVQLDFDNNGAGHFEIKNGSQALVFSVNESGNATLAGSLTQNSDRRLKKDMETLPYGLKEILQLQPKAYNWKDRTQKHKSLGLIAQEVQPIIKEIVNASDDEMKTLGISYTELIPVLINAIKEQQTVIDSEKLKVATLETLVNNQQVDISELKTMVQQLLVKDETALLEKR